MKLSTNPPTHAGLRALALFVLYIVIVVGLILMYGKGSFSTPPFIYQGF